MRAPLVEATPDEIAQLVADLVEAGLMDADVRAVDITDVDILETRS
jgi:hypothetical protein